jgi:hypothetical protein
MLVLVNYKINKDNSISIQRYQENGKDIIIYDEKSLAVIDTNIDTNENLTLMKLEMCQYPIVITEKQANALISKIEKSPTNDTKSTLAKEEGDIHQDVKENKTMRLAGGRVLEDKKE